MTRKQFDIDKLQIADFKKKVAKKYLTEFLIISSPILILFFTILVFGEVENLIGIILIFSFVILGIAIRPCRHIAIMEHFTKCSFVIDEKSLQLYIKGVKKKSFTHGDIYVLKQNRLGTFVLQGDLSVFELHYGKYETPLSLTNKKNIFIPYIAENYTELVSKLTEISKEKTSR